MPSTSPSSTSPHAAASEPLAAPSERTVLARRILLEALFLGGLGDSLLHEGPGLGLFIWTVALALIVLRMARRRPEGARREQIAWVVAMLFLAGCFAWRDSSGLLFYDLLAMAGAGLLLVATLGPSSPIPSILGQRVRDLAAALGFALRAGAGGLVAPLRDSGIGARAASHRGGARAALRAVALATPVLLVFGVLFGVADPVFGSLLALPKIQVDEVVKHLLLASVIAWATAGWLQGAFTTVATAPRKGRHVAFSLGTLDVTVILGGLLALFGIFVAVQVGWLFGGERLVRSTTGLGYAEYARHGFFELVWVSLLVLPVLLGTRALIGESDATAVRRHRLLAAPLLVLVGGVMASAFGRMALYVHYYGPSTARLYASVFMGWLAVVFVWFGLTILRGRTRDFAAGMAITGLVTLAGLNVVNPEALVARASVQRARVALALSDSIPAPSVTAPVKSASSPIDYWYLTGRLDGDAVSEVISALRAQPVAAQGSAAREAEVRARCDAVRRLLERWGTAAPALDWRRWDFGAWRARRAVRSQEVALRAVACWDAAGEVPFGTRERRTPANGEQWYRDETK